MNANVQQWDSLANSPLQIKQPAGPSNPPNLDFDHAKIRCVYINWIIVTLSVTMLCPGTHMWDNKGDLDIGYGDLNLKPFFTMVGVLLVVLIAYLSVQGSDPGYLYKEMFQDDDKDDEAVLLENSENIFEKSPPSENDGKLNIHNQETKKEETLSTSESQDSTKSSTDDEFYTKHRRNYCQSCEFSPPLRSHHCRYCDRCVATFDHHCSFIGTCIGERNHCRFYWFLTFQLVGFLFCISIIQSSRYQLSNISTHNQQFYNNMEVQHTNRSTSSFISDSESSVGDEVFRIIGVMICQAYIFSLTFFAAMMWLTHTLYALSNLTTFEVAKGPKHIEYLKGTKHCDLPFSRRLDQNIAQFCCSRDACWNRFIRFCERIFCCRKENKVNSSNFDVSQWKPIHWNPPGKIVRDSEDWLNHPWQNKYYSCC